MSDVEDAGILHGFEAIGRHLGVSADAARGRVAKEGMPIARSGRRVWIRRSTLNAWLADREAAVLAAQHRPPQGC